MNARVLLPSFSFATLLLIAAASWGVQSNSDFVGVWRFQHDDPKLVSLLLFEADGTGHFYEIRTDGAVEELRNAPTTWETDVDGNLTFDDTPVFEIRPDGILQPLPDAPPMLNYAYTRVSAYGGIGDDFRVLAQHPERGSPKYPGLSGCWRAKSGSQRILPFDISEGEPSPAGGWTRIGDRLEYLEIGTWTDAGKSPNVLGADGQSFVASNGWRWSRQSGDVSSIIGRFKLDDPKATQTLKEQGSSADWSMVFNEDGSTITESGGSQEKNIGRWTTIEAGRSYGTSSKRIDQVTKITIVNEDELTSEGRFGVVSGRLKARGAGRLTRDPLCSLKL